MMNTYIQDDIIPIYMILQYGLNVMKFPINPEQLKKIIPSNSKTTEVEDIGEISVPTTPKLAEITINSFFWQDVNLVPSSAYVEWLERWQRSKKPALLIVTRLNFSMFVTCEELSHWINAGEDKDIYFELKIKEYRPHSARKLTSKPSLLKKIRDTLDEIPIVLFDIPRPTRSNITKESIINPYVVKEHETLTTITKKITGDSSNWDSLYEENKKELSDIIMESSEIPSGTKLTLPDDWISNESYGITSTL